jgi:hypothetical protein
MNEQRYSFENLRKHTSAIRAQTASTLREHQSSIDRAFANFSKFINELEQQPISLERNVKMMLACKLLNHVYSALILAEYGLIVDALLCERNALETVAFHWLICLDPVSASEYQENDIPRPVEVRRRLEKLGADISSLRDLYSSVSEITHVGRRSERFHSTWKNTSSGELRIGGHISPKDQAEMFQFLPALFDLFYEPLVQK